MKNNNLALTLRTILFLGAIASDVSLANAQESKSVAGTYAPVSVSAFGTNPRGRLVLGQDGYYSLILLRSSLPKVSSGSRNKGTAEENQAIVGGSIGHYGKYSVDSAAKTIIFSVEASTYPNWDGQTFNRPLKISRDQLTYTNTAPSAGGGPDEVVWRKLK